jgi:hypothetical protein
LANPNVQPNFSYEKYGLLGEMFVKNSLLLFEYSIDMTNTVFPMFQTQYFLNFSSTSRSGTLVLAKH